MKSYFTEIQRLLSIVSEQEQRQIESASKIIAECFQNGGILQLFGCGHSHLLAQDTYYRAGGLVPIRPITIEPLMLHYGALTSSKNEKDPAFIKNHLETFEFKKKDVLIVISTSGCNPVPIDVALLGKEAGITVISLQSLEYKEQLTRNESGYRLEEVVDLVLNTHIPVGDGILSLQGVQYGPASTVIGSAILHALFSQVIESLDMDRLPVFQSANLSANQSANLALIDQYKDRIDFE
ncbi:SIS domain-containing protein [Cytobacillus solani]|uniref:sugar isomerase domain-containing protein n=1 Tax=Cytobacillus solani TaxID=1637975 RepID=UPI002079843A|nr:SIS domain-containing protein [Cytobacillus solani]USK55941.1 SIS domain-containing protein [Cytobacillus solani]